MIIISFFDLEKLSHEKIFEQLELDFFTENRQPIIGVIADGNKVSRSSDIKQLLTEFGADSSWSSLEIYSCVGDRKDPEKEWATYLSFNSRDDEKLDCTIAFDESLKIDNEFAIKLIQKIAAQGTINYGFSLNWNEPRDGIYYSMGISTEGSSDEQQEEDSRWFNERLNMCSGQVVVDTFNSDNSNFMGDRSSFAECNLSTL